MRRTSPIPIFCQCLYCLVFFEIRKRRKYCRRKCRDAAYYRRKTERAIVAKSE